MQGAVLWDAVFGELHFYGQVIKGGASVGWDYSKASTKDFDDMGD